MQDFETTDKYIAYFFNYDFSHLCLQIHIYHKPLLFIVINIESRAGHD